MLLRIVVLLCQFNRPSFVKLSSSDGFWRGDGYYIYIRKRVESKIDGSRRVGNRKARRKVNAFISVIVVSVVVLHSLHFVSIPAEASGPSFSSRAVLVPLVAGPSLFYHTILCHAYL